ncbi:MAG: ParB/RepB/Spo0J family partition protein [Clostridia bacterium]|nr:ParB/RepB/Spo0J family partition protein [Clostridia bacterium]
MAKKINTETTESVEKKLVYIPITELHPHPDNPRKDLGDLSELAESIKVKGVMQNLTVVPRAEGGYTVIIGHRRMGASKLAGLTELPCVIVDMSPQEQVATMLLENMQRSDLTVYEQAQGFQMMFDFGESIDSIAEKTGFSKTTVSRRLKMAELNQDTLKKVSERQLSLTDFDRLSKIEDIEERNKVLAEIGTRNFENALTKALSDQKDKANMKRWREALTERGIIEIPADDKWNHDKYEMLPYATLSGETDQLDEILQGDGPFYYCFDWGTLYLRKAKAVSAEDEAEKIRKAKRQDEERIKREGLSAAFERAYELRFNFVKGVSEATAKKHFPDIVRFLVELGCHFYAEFDWAMFAELAGVEVDEDECDEDVVWEALKPSADNRTYYAALAYAYSISNDSANMKCYSWRFEFENNSTLNTIYAFLEKLGYEMSDEECELLNGESDLYIKPESSMENKKDEDNEEEIIEAELVEDEDPADEDETSDEDAERDDILERLRAEYGGETDDE